MQHVAAGLLYISLVKVWMIFLSGCGSVQPEEFLLHFYLLLVHLAAADSISKDT